MKKIQKKHLFIGFALMAVGYILYNGFGNTITDANMAHENVETTVTESMNKVLDKNNRTLNERDVFDENVEDDRDYTEISEQEYEEEVKAPQDVKQDIQDTQDEAEDLLLEARQKYGKK